MNLKNKIYLKKIKKINKNPNYVELKKEFFYNINEI